jgi:hypothetical protein
VVITVVLFNVTTAVPKLLTHPPDGSVALLNNTLTDPEFPPVIAKKAEEGAVPNRQERLTLSLMVTVVVVSERRVHVTDPARK